MGILVETTHRTLDNKVSGKRRERVKRREKGKTKRKEERESEWGRKKEYFFKIRLGGLPTNGKPRFVSFGWASEEGKPRNQDSIWWASEVRLSGDFRKMKKTKFRSDVPKNGKIPRFIRVGFRVPKNGKIPKIRSGGLLKKGKSRNQDSIWRASEERKTKKPRFVRSGGLPKNENPKIRSGGLPKNENQKIKIRLGGLLCGKTKIRFGLASDLQKSGTKIRLGCLGCLPKNGKNQRFVSLGVLLKNNQRFVYTNT
ncbi:uncharacterized protein OCT59_003532 [Rhizophagus irregularis]|uniref:uncharacterized protein n=1 Tax=Rhizophagus irregularis TaxID=588596 RepID=UPI003330D4AB|nr:hypothetical protein OCT59_003532 [Rhizophagus irregularis]